MDSAEAAAKGLTDSSNEYACPSGKYWDPLQKQCYCQYGSDADGTCRTSTATGVCDATNCATCTSGACSAFDTSNQPTDEECFALNAVREKNAGDDGAGCKPMSGFQVVYSYDNVWRAERTADDARTNCALGTASKKFTVTELQTEIDAQLGTHYKHLFKGTPAMEKFLKFHETWKCSANADASANYNTPSGWAPTGTSCPSANGFTGNFPACTCPSTKFSFLDQCFDAEREEVGVKCDKHKIWFID